MESPIAGNSRESLLAEFVGWAGTHIKGDEKGEAQIFLDHLFRAFGQKGSLDVGGTAEMRIRKSDEDGGGTSFADYVWKPIVLIEMKKRGTDLSRHYRQAFDYWVRLVPDRPQYVVLCNFDEFHVYDFNNQIDSPKDKVKLAELPGKWGPLAFLFPTKEKPVFGNDQEKVTREAADRLALCFKKLITRKVDRGLAQRFILQTLVALFAEDIGLLPRYMLGTLLEECKKPADSYDLIGGLFEAMNTPDSPAGGRYKGVRYFNGGIFAHPARIELYDDELNQLKQCSAGDWSKVSPEIFGALFQDSMEAEERHAYGAHFTSPIDILKIVGPTIRQPWEEAIKNAKSAKKLNELLERLTTLRVLDPACGSGNFLYLAYREMKRLESLIRERLTTEFPDEQPRLIHVNARQFFGMDISPFAVELAKVTLMIARKLAIDELHIGDEQDLPLDNLDGNFRIGDALLTPADNGMPPVQTQWPAADVIIGNPPFLGAKRLKPERGPDYVNALRKLYAEVPGMADYCVYWFRRAHDHLPECTNTDPLAGRAGLVGTQNIRNNQSRVGGLDHIVKTGTVIEAVDNQPWSGDANVHVSIANWIKTTDANTVPKTRTLWTKVAPKAGRVRTANGGPRADKQYELVSHTTNEINSALSDSADASGALGLNCNRTPQRVFQGNTPGHEGFVLDGGERNAILGADPSSSSVVYPYLIGREILTGDGTPERWIIDFERQTILESKSHPAALKHVEQKVLPTIQQNADEEKLANERRGKSSQDKTRQSHLERWWMHWRGRADRIAACQSLRGRCLVCSRVTKRPIFVFIDLLIRPGDALQTFTFDDDYSFGILQSATHWLWFITKCSKLKSDFRYTPESVFDTFPWPQSPTKKQIDAVAAAAVSVRKVRSAALQQIDGGLRALYRTLELPGKNPLKDAHAALDAAVLAAYGFDAKKDLLSQLLDLNRAVATREK
jgi:SAM-dependent methyltransferase